MSKKIGQIMAGMQSRTETWGGVFSYRHDGRNGAVVTDGTIMLFVAGITGSNSFLRLSV
jgi:hypothetical protein